MKKVKSLHGRKASQGFLLWLCFGELPSHGMTSVTGSEELVEVSQPRVPPAGTPSGVPVF